MQYNFSGIKDIETDKTSSNPGTVGLWAGNAEQRQNYLELFNPAYKVESDYNIYTAAGLYYNFELIKFTLYDYESVDNEGEYKKIGNKTSGDITGEEFIIEGEAEEVHNLTLKELNQARGESETSTDWVDDNDAATGLFYLKGLGEEFGYAGSVYPNYWLAFPESVFTLSLGYVYETGTIQTSSYGWKGIRPVVSLKSNIQIKKIER